MIFRDHEVDYSISFIDMMDLTAIELTSEEHKFGKLSFYDIQNAMEKAYDKYCKEIDEREFGGKK